MIRCLTLDDEQLALEVLETYIEKVPLLHLVKACASAMEAIGALANAQRAGAPVDLLFLDIEMPDLTGLQLLRTLKHPPMIIFTTAYPHYALEGFELDAVDYLLKPIPFTRFLKAVHKVQERMPPTVAPTAEGSLNPSTDQGYIFVKADHKTLRVDLADILWVEGLKDYVIIHTRGKKIITLLSLHRLLEKLPASAFLRVHRSFIVALNKIESIERNRIQIGAAEIPIGDLYKDDLAKRLS